MEMVRAEHQNQKWTFVEAIVAFGGVERQNKHILLFLMESNEKFFKKPQIPHVDGIQRPRMTWDRLLVHANSMYHQRRSIDLLIIIPKSFTNNTIGSTTPQIKIVCSSKRTWIFFESQIDYDCIITRSRGDWFTRSKCQLCNRRNNPRTGSTNTQHNLLGTWQCRWWRRRYFDNSIDSMLWSRRIDTRIIIIMGTLIRQAYMRLHNHRSIEPKARVNCTIFGPLLLVGVCAVCARWAYQCASRTRHWGASVEIC